MAALGKGGREIDNAAGDFLETTRPPLTFTMVPGFPKALTASWTLALTVTSATRGLRIGVPALTSTYDIEWVSVPAGAAAPTDTYGEAVLAGEDFTSGPPKGDLYLRSATGQIALVKTGV